MSEPSELPVGELDRIVSALVGLARDRGATSAQLATLGGVWAEHQAAALSGATAPGLSDRAAGLAADLLGVDALLAPANAPYGGFWQEAEAAVTSSGAVTPPPRSVERAELVVFDPEDPTPDWAALAAHGLTGPLRFVDACAVIEALARVVAPGPYLQTISLLPALPGDERERVADGESSWALAIGPLVLALDSATSVAIVGGDGIFELVGADRELLATRDLTRPLGVVIGGDAGRRLGDSTSLPLVRRRLLTGLAFEALGVIDAIEPTSPAGAARALADEAARRVEADDPEADQFAAAAKALACDLAFEISTAAIAKAAADSSVELARLHERARSIRAWEASPAHLRTEIGETLLERGGDE